MAGRKAAPKDGAGNSTDLTTRELQILGLAWQCFDAPPKIDYDKLANLVGMNNPRSASNALSAIKKKLGIPAGAAKQSADTGDASGGKRKAAAKGQDGDKPSKKRKGKDAKTEEVAGGDDAAEEDEEDGEA